MTKLVKTITIIKGVPMYKIICNNCGKKFITYTRVCMYCNEEINKEAFKTYETYLNKELNIYRRKKLHVGIVSLVIAFLQANGEFITLFDDVIYRDFSFSNFALAILLAFIGIILIITRKASGKISYLIPAGLYFSSALVFSLLLIIENADFYRLNIIPIGMGLYMLFLLYIHSAISAIIIKYNEDSK